MKNLKPPITILIGYLAAGAKLQLNYLLAAAEIQPQLPNFGQSAAVHRKLTAIEPCLFYSKDLLQYAP